MPPESWLVITVAAAFLLLGVAGSPLAWAMLTQRRLQLQKTVAQSLNKLAVDLRTLDERMTRLETIALAQLEARDPLRPDAAGGRASQGGAFAIDPSKGRFATSPAPSAMPRRGPYRADSAHEPTLIAVPSLEDAPGNRQNTVGGLRDRYAAIWTLADNGASAEVIARATGQPIGQIELILGLRRQIDGTTTNSAHSPGG